MRRCWPPPPSTRPASLTETAIFCRQDRRGRGDGAPAQPPVPAAGYAAGGMNPWAGSWISHSGDQSGVQHHRLQVQRPDHYAGRGEHEGRGGEDPGAGPEHRVRERSMGAGKHRIRQSHCRRAAHRRGEPGFGPHQATHSGDKGRRDAHRCHLWPKNGVGTYYGQRPCGAVGAVGGEAGAPVGRPAGGSDRGEA